MNAFPCRCIKCRARKTLKLLPEQYEDSQIPYCPCGGTYKLDTYRKEREHKRTNCFCDGYPWTMTNGPHRKGSLKCYYASSENVENVDQQSGTTSDFPF